jgi:hypothetical protein
MSSCDNYVGKKSRSQKLLSFERFLLYIPESIMCSQTFLRSVFILFFLRERKRERDRVGIFILKLEWKNTCVPQCVTPHDVLVHESRKACLMSYSIFFSHYFVSHTVIPTQLKREIDRSINWIDKLDFWWRMKKALHEIIQINIHFIVSIVSIFMNKCLH